MIDFWIISLFPQPLLFYDSFKKTLKHVYKNKVSVEVFSVAVIDM